MPLTCPDCAEAIPANATSCPSCGVALGSAAAPKKKGMETWMIVLIVCGALVMLCSVTSIVAAIAIPNLLVAKLSSNETAAIATLRNLASCQAQMQTSGRIDADGDGIGEYGTLMELTGSVGTRAEFRPDTAGAPASSGFERTGKRSDPPILSPALAKVDARGVTTKSGYCFAIYLPDSSMEGGWTRETNAAAPTGFSPGLSGGSGRVGVDRSETRWCAYAWPMSRGNSGNRAFFVDDKGVVFQCPNDAVGHSGPGSPPYPDAAFPPGQDRPLPGALGGDGEVWTVVN